MNLTTIDDVRERVWEAQREKWDQPARGRTLRYDRGELALPGTLPEGRPRLLRPTPWAEAQLCQRIGVPTAYFRKCPPHLKDAQFNHWIGQAEWRLAEARWTLRCRGAELRGVVSERYARLDDVELVGALARVVQGRFGVEWLSLGDESLHLRLVDPERGRNVLPDDRLVVGVHVANSEVGKRAVTVDALVYRLVCSNGLVRLVKGKSLLHRRHVHAPGEGLVEALGRAVECAAIEAGNAIERLEAATTEIVPEPEKALAGIAEKNVLPERVVQDALRALSFERRAQQHTLYGMVNALTNAAQRLGPDERYELETVAAELLN
jgi:hypothetical protein